MSQRDEYRPGVPWWVETLQPDPRAALDFYGALFGWDFGPAHPMDGGLPGEYFVARVDGRAVAGIGTLPPDGQAPGAVWNTHVRVDSADDAVDRATVAGATAVLGPVAASAAGRLAVLVDPTGAAFSVSDAGSRPGAQLVNEPGAWAMSSLHTPDPPRASAFYGTVFGWKTEAIAPESPVMLFRLPGHLGGEAGGAIPRDVVGVMTATEAAPDGPAIPPNWSVNFGVDDAELIVARGADLGGTLLMPPIDALGMRTAVLLDPQGAAFSISQAATAS